MYDSAMAFSRNLGQRVLRMPLSLQLQPKSWGFAIQADQNASFFRKGSHRRLATNKLHQLPKDLQGTMLATVRRFATLLPRLSYPLTRDVMLPHCSLLVLILGLVLIPVLTLYAVAATGYEYVTITTTNFNATQPMWYDVLNYGGWILPSIMCQPSILKPGDGTSDD